MDRDIALWTFAGAFLGGAGLGFAVSGRPWAALWCLVAQVLVFASAAGPVRQLARRAWRRVVVGRAQVYVGRAVLKQGDGCIEARTPPHIRIPPGYRMAWRGFEVGGQPFIHYEIRPAQGLAARWLRLRHPAPIDRRPHGDS